MSSKIGVYGTTSAGTAAGHADKRGTVKIMLVHEHDLVPRIFNEMRYFRCITCSTIYCQSCGKSLEASTIHNHQVDKFEYSEKVGLAY